MKEWIVNTGYMQYNVSFEKNKVTINNETKPLRKFKRKNHNMLVTAYEIPLGDCMALLYVSAQNSQQADLVINGTDVATGAPYEPIVLPKWIWAFYGLYIFNFIVLFGGAIGGAFQFLCAFATSAVVASKKITASQKIIISILIGAFSFVLSLFVTIAVIAGRTK